MRYNTILIVGNGFDLNLDLKTSYTDFIRSKHIEEHLKSHSNSLIKHLCEQSKSRWIDIENELKGYSAYLCKPPVQYNKRSLTLNSDIMNEKERAVSKRNFRSEYNELCKVLKEYLEEKNQELSIDIQNSAAYKVLHKNCEKRCHILNFNYTDSIKKIIRSNFGYSSETKIDEVIQYVHGNLKEDIVFGIEDSGNVHPDHVFLYKSHNPQQNIHGLHTLFEDTRGIEFFGYSLGETDHSYFDDFFKDQSKNGCTHKDLTFYYYDEKAYDNLIVQLNTLTDHRLSKLKQYNSVNFIKVSDIK